MTTIEVPQPAYELRPYQRESIDRTLAADARGVRNQLGVAATGLGKTITFVHLARERGGRTLILVHRDELVRQAYDKVTEIWPEAQIGIVKAESNQVGAQVVIASVQTLSRDKRLGQLLATTQPTVFDDGQIFTAGRAYEPFNLIIVDEAHHTAAATYRKILDAFDAGTEDGPLLLGVTATPDRGDGKGLDDLFGEIVWNYDILWGIRADYLCDVRGKLITVADLDLSKVKVRAGDYDQGQVGRAMEESNTPTAVVQAWRTHASDRRTLVFTPTVAVAHRIAEIFQENGVNAEAVDASTPLDERRAMLARYATGETQVLTNCGVLTEGYDEPRTDCIVMARPTRSRALFTQCIGRGTRKHPDKTDLLVLDIVGASLEHSLVTIPSLFGLEPKYAARVGGEGVSGLLQEHDDEQVALGLMRAEDAELFRRLRAESGIHWLQVHGLPHEAKRYQRSLGKAQPTVVLVEKDASRWNGWLCGVIEPDGKKRVLVANMSLETAQGVGEDFIRKTLHGRMALVNTDAPWRKRHPTVKQLQAAAKWRLPTPEIYATAGHLSDALDAHIARVKAKSGPRA